MVSWSFCGRGFTGAANSMPCSCSHQAACNVLRVVPTMHVQVTGLGERAGC